MNIAISVYQPKSFIAPNKSASTPAKAEKLSHKFVFCM